MMCEIYIYPRNESHGNTLLIFTWFYANFAYTNGHSLATLIVVCVCVYTHFGFQVSYDTNG